MYSFFKNCILFCFAAAAVSIIFLFIFLKVFNLSYNDLPDPAISNSWGLNQKMALLRNRNVDILGIGASITENNLDSKTVTETFNTKSFFDASSVGLSKKDIYEFLKIYHDIHKVKKVIISSSFSDYFHTDKVVDYPHLKKYLSSTGYDQLTLKKFSLQYLLCGMTVKRAKQYAKDYNLIPSGAYDYYGAQILKKITIAPNLKAEYKQGLFTDFDSYRTNTALRNHGLIYLDSISNFCKKNDIELYYFQAAVDGAYVAGRKDILDTLASLAATEQKIMNGENQHYVKTYDKVWADSLFSDYQHMNEIGAAIFTKYCLSQSIKQ